MKAILNMIVVLSLICATSGFLLSSLRESTASTIEEQVLTYVQAPAIKLVFGDTENDPIAERKKITLENGEELMLFPVKQGGKLTGVGIERFAPGYGGAVGVIVGINTEKENIVGIGVTTMSETPGLGTLIAEPRFTEQFINHAKEAKLSSQGGDIDAVSGATISSAAVTSAVAQAFEVYATIKDQLANLDN